MIVQRIRSPYFSMQTSPDFPDIVNLEVTGLGLVDIVDVPFQHPW